MKKKAFGQAWLLLAVSALAITVIAAGTREVKPVSGESASPVAYYPTRITSYDFGGEEVVVTFEKAPERVITYWQNSVENMIALGLEDKIIAAIGVRADEIKPEYQAAFKKIPLVQDKRQDKESTLALRPDFILGWYSTFSEKYLGSVKFWHDRKIFTYVARNSGVPSIKQSLAMEYEDILNLGKIFNVEARAEALVNAMKAKVEQGRAYAKGRKQVGVIILEDEGKAFRIYGENTIGGDIAIQVGANLLAKDKNVRKSAEDLVVLNPEMIFGIHFGPGSSSLNDKNCLDVFKTNKALWNIEAVKNGKLYPTDLSLVYCPGVRVIDSIDFFLSHLYPDMKKD